jgi:monoamine oxidase
MTSPAPERVFDVAVVGGGLSGLSAARRIAAAGRSVLVLEARDRVGGKMRTDHVAGHHADMGAHWIGPTQDRVAALAAELGVRTQPQHLDGRAVLVARGRRRTFKGSLPPLSPPALAELGVAQLRLDRLRKRVPLEEPWALAVTTDWDRQTAAAFKRRYLRTAGARMFFDLATELIFGAEPEELSLLYFLFYLQSGGGLTSLTEFEGGAQEEHFVGGSQQLCDLLAAQLGDGVRLGTAVAGIEQGEDELTLRTEDGTVHRARLGIVAVSPALAARWHWARPLPADRDQLAQRMPMGAYMKVVVAYERRWWRDAGLSGIAYADSGPLQMVVEASGADAQGGLLACFITGRAVERYGRLELGARQAAVREALTRMFGTAAGDWTAYAECDWTTEPYSRGGPVGVMGPEAMGRYGHVLRRPEGLVHWAGTDTATVWNGYMDGAIQAGERAADEVLAKLAS